MNKDTFLSSITLMLVRMVGIVHMVDGKNQTSSGMKLLKYVHVIS